MYCIQGKFRPHFIFPLFALWPEGEFTTGLIELWIKDYIGKLERGRIQGLGESVSNLCRAKIRLLESKLYTVYRFINGSFYNSTKEGISTLDAASMSYLLSLSINQGFLVTFPELVYCVSVEQNSLQGKTFWRSLSVTKIWRNTLTLFCDCQQSKALHTYRDHFIHHRFVYPSICLSFFAGSTNIFWKHNEK